MMKNILIAVHFAMGWGFGLSSWCFSQQNPSETKYEWTKPEFWQSQDGRPVTEGWEFQDGEIRLVKSREGNAALISPPMPSHFELTFQWRVSPGTNSGLKYRLRQFGDLWLGLEYQMIDERIPLAAPDKGSTASIYELIAPKLDKPLKPAGQWNDARIVVKGTSLEHYLNGVLVTQATASGPEWDACIARSKFFGHANFGLPRSDDRIMLTDHGGTAAFRNLRLVELAAPLENIPQPVAPQLGNGMRNSWADSNSIVLWSRTTARSNMVTEGPDFLPVATADRNRLSQSSNEHELVSAQIPEGASLEKMLGACPGAAGEIRLTYFPVLQRYKSRSTDWVATIASKDFTHQWRITDLIPGTEYAAVVETRPLGSQTLSCVQRGHFQTPPLAEASSGLVFCMTTCHDFPRRDAGDKGHKIYQAMEPLKPNFVVHAGDIEYYDHEKPWAWTVDLMRFKWARIFSLPNNRSFYANHTTYFMKDDHDTLKNDCWAGQRYGAVSFEQGMRLFNEEQFPSHSPRYKTVSWGKDLQIWMLEGRDFRSPNQMPDGPNKTILGAEQKSWLLKTLKESTAKYKLVFSPTPIVGPDRDNKHDNHSNLDFRYEGDELRREFAKVQNVIVFCGDRHWQYASVDDSNRLWEFGCGPGSEKHELGWKQGDVRSMHRFLRVEGGFLSGTLTYQADNLPELTIRHHKVTGEQVSSFTFK